MADTQILPLGTTSTPASYTLPNAQTVTIGALFAHYDGSGAAGSYVPTVDIISDSGHTVLSVVQDSTVAAGTSVEASWAPFLRTKTAATAGVGITTAFRVSNLATQACPAGAAKDLTWNVTVSSIGSPFTTADSKTFLLALGFWEIGYMVTCSADANQARTGPTDIRLNDTGGVGLFHTNLFWTDGNRTMNDGISVTGTTTLDGRVTAIHLKSALDNFTGAGITVLSGTDASYLYGNLLIGP